MSKARRWRERSTHTANISPPPEFHIIFPGLGSPIDFRLREIPRTETDNLPRRNKRIAPGEVTLKSCVAGAGSILRQHELERRIPPQQRNHQTRQKAHETSTKNARETDKTRRRDCELGLAYNATMKAETMPGLVEFVAESTRIEGIGGPPMLEPSYAFIILSGRGLEDLCEFV